LKQTNEIFVTKEPKPRIHNIKPESKTTVTSDHELDEELTVMERFHKWCKKEGVIAPKFEYPHMFGGPEYPYPGVLATDDIKHREMMVAIPYDIILTKEKARACKMINKQGDKYRTLGDIMDHYPQQFDAN
jgi:hypothetical protein